MDDDLEPAALGTVVDEDRGHLPYALIHGEALVAAAAWALGEAGVTLVDVGTPWEAIVEAEEPFVLHDSLCPMTPPAFIAECVAHAVARGCVVVGVRPVTDTVKVVTDGVVGETVDRTDLVAVASPVVLPASVVASLDDLPASDLVALVAELRRRYPVELVEAPPFARRVGSVEDLRVLEALTAGSSLTEWLPERHPMNRSVRDYPDGASRSASARSSGNVILRLAGLLATATTGRSE